MIPDKIYIPRYPNLDTDGFHLGDDWMEKPDIYSKCEHVEYIRKDALMEWINEARAIPHENAITRDLAFQEVVNYLVNEM